MSRVGRSPLTPARSLALAVTGPLLTAMVAIGSRLSWAAAAATAAPLAAAAALRRPHAALVAGWVCVIFIPIYWGLQLTPGIALVPATAVCLILLPAAAAAFKDVRVGALDVAVLLFFATQAVAFLLNFESGASSTVALLSRGALGYGVVRCLSLLPSRRLALASATVGCCVLFGVLAQLEARGVDNPLFEMIRGVEAEVWARPELRFGSVRAEVTFGHPIALGLFLVQGVVLAVALSTVYPRRLPRYLIAVFLIGAGVLTTLSRTPFVAAAAALLLLALGLRRRQRWLLLPILAVPLAVLAFSPGAGTVGDLAGSLEGQSQAADSAEYRVRLLGVVTDPDNFSLFGRFTAVEGAGSVNSVARQIGFPSFDNYFALVYLVTGAVPLLTLVILCSIVWREAVAPKLRAVDRGWACAAAGATLGLLSVGLLTQYGDLLWFNIALVASARQARLSGEADAVAPESQLGVQRDRHSAPRRATPGVKTGASELRPGVV